MAFPRPSTGTTTPHPRIFPVSSTPRSPRKPKASCPTQRSDPLTNRSSEPYSTALLKRALTLRSYAVGMLCRAMACPTPSMLDAARRVLCYLSHHRSVGLR
eukprot:4436084-Pleurochrysis_carterae.AAC.1